MGWEANGCRDGKGKGKGWRMVEEEGFVKGEGLRAWYCAWYCAARDKGWEEDMETELEVDVRI